MNQSQPRIGEAWIEDFVDDLDRQLGSDLRVDRAEEPAEFRARFRIPRPFPRVALCQQLRGAADRVERMKNIQSRLFAPYQACRFRTPFRGRLGGTKVATVMVAVQSLLLANVVRAQSAVPRDSASPTGHPGSHEGAAKDASSSAPATKPTPTTRPITLRLQGGPGALAPVSPGGGVGISLSHRIGEGFAWGIAGHAAGGTVNKESNPAKDHDRRANTAAMYQAGMLLAWFPQGARTVPMFSVGAGWGKLLMIDAEKSNRPYEGSGLVLTAEVGVLISGLYPVLLRADIPAFQLRHTSDGDQRLYGLCASVEFGLTLF